MNFRLLLIPLTIHFSFGVGDKPLELSTATYKNAFGEPFSVEQCKYYISDITVIGEDGKTQLIFSGAHLVDAADSPTLTLNLTTDIAGITKIRFKLGIDSETAAGDVKTGDLDPMLGMFWTWNTGYVFARLEGQSDSARAPAHRYTWDVGGYRTGVNAVREISLSVGGSSPITIKANILHWFDGRHPIHLAQTPICHQPGALAMQLADNYSTLFSLSQ
jgi:hypothetical protein